MTHIYRQTRDSSERDAIDFWFNKKENRIKYITFHKAFCYQLIKKLSKHIEECTNMCCIPFYKNAVAIFIVDPNETSHTLDLKLMEFSLEL